MSRAFRESAGNRRNFLPGRRIRRQRRGTLCRRRERETGRERGREGNRARRLHARSWDFRKRDDRQGPAGTLRDREEEVAGRNNDRLSHRFTLSRDRQRRRMIRISIASSGDRNMREDFTGPLRGQIMPLYR